MPKKLDLVVLASDTIEQWGERFAFDYSTLRFKERVPLDYEHWDDVIVGYAEKFNVSDERVAASAELLSDDDSPSERAKEIAYGLDHGVPYETSCLIDLADADAVFIKDKETVNVNGRELTGPLTLFSNAEIRGVAICPHGADSLTSATLALAAGESAEGAFVRATARSSEPVPAGRSESKNFVALSVGEVKFYMKGRLMSEKELKSDELIKLSATEDETVEPTAEQTETSETATDETVVDEQSDPVDSGTRELDAALSALVDEFGAEEGIEFYRRGLSLEAARLENFAALKEQSDAEIASLREKVKELEAKVVELSAARRGDPVGVSETASRKQELQSDALFALAAKYKKNGVVRLS